MPINKGEHEPLQAPMPSPEEFHGGGGAPSHSFEPQAPMPSMPTPDSDDQEPEEHATTAAPPPFDDDSVLSSEMPQGLRNQISMLEKWAQDNLRDSKRDRIAFWSLKLPAIVSSASSGLLAMLSWDLFATILGTLAGICILIDGIHPRGMLRNTHLQAVHDLRILQDEVRTRWDADSLVSDDLALLASEIIKSIQDEKRRISQYIMAAETSLQYKQSDTK